MKKIAVLGSNLSAMALALEAKKLGYAVEVADSHSELCPEITMAGHSFMRLGHSPYEIYAPVGGLKKLYMQKLLDADIKPLLMSTPVGLAMMNESAVGAVVGNKFGMQVLYTDCIIDATANAEVFGKKRFPEAVVASYTFVVKRAKTLYENEMLLPEALGVYENKVYFHPQVIPDTMTVEIRLLLQVTGTFGERAKWELTAREKAVRVFSYLKTQQRLKNIILDSTAAELCLPCIVNAEEEIKGVIRYTPRITLSPTTDSLDEERERARSFLSSLAIEEQNEKLIGCIRIGNARITDFHCGKPETALRNMAPLFIRWEASGLPVLEAQAVVAGAGTSGMPAAIALIENGKETAVIESLFQVGGTRTVGRVSGHYHGNRAGVSERLNNEVKALSESFTGNGELTDINARMLLYASYLQRENCKAYLGTTACGAWTEDNTLRGVIVCSDEGVFILKSRVTVDTTSDADVAALSGVGYEYGSPRDGTVMTNGQWGVMNWTSEVFTDDPWRRDYDVIRGDDYADLLRGYYIAHGGRNSDIDFSSLNTLRETRHIHGRYTLTLSDVLLERAFPDIVAFGRTSYDTHGRASSAFITMGMLYDEKVLFARVPYRCFLPERVEGLLVGGKAISATRDTGSLCRMIADVENAGYAIGLAAAMAVEGGCAVSQIDIQALREKLKLNGCLTEPVPARNITARKAYDDLCAGGENALSEVLLQQKEEILPMLEETDASAIHGNTEDFFTAKCWFGCADGVKKILELTQNTRDLENWGNLESNVGYGMKRITYDGELGGYHLLNRYIHLLGMAADKTALPELIRQTYIARSGGEPVKGENPYHKNRLDTRRVPGFERIAALCFSIERMADASAADALTQLLADEHITGYIQRNPYSTVNFPLCAWLELTVAQTLARCGGRMGYERMIDYLSDTREVFVRHTEEELARITGEAYGRDAEAWTGWLNSREKLPVVPYTLLTLD